VKTVTCFYTCSLRMFRNRSLPRQINTNFYILVNKEVKFIHVKIGFFVFFFLFFCFVLSFLFFFFCDSPQRAMASSFTMFLDNTQRRITVSRTPLDKWSARRRDLYLTTQSTHNRQTSMPTVGFEPTISAGERPQTYALDRAATGTDT